MRVFSLNSIASNTAVAGELEMPQAGTLKYLL